VELMRQQTKFWGERFGRLFEVIVRIMLDYNEKVNKAEQLTLLDLYRIILKKENLKEFVKLSRDFILRSYVEEALQIKGEEQSREALLRRLNDWLHNKIVRKIISCKTSSFNFNKAIISKKIILVRIPQGEIGSCATQLIGSMIVTLLWAAIKSKECTKREPFFLYVDELHNFIFKKSLFDVILSEARAFKLGLILASQYPSQLSKGIKRAIYGNCSTFVAFNIQNPEDAEFAAKRLLVTGSDLVALSPYKAYVRTRCNLKKKTETHLMLSYPPLPKLWDADRVMKIAKFSINLYDELSHN